MGTDPVTHKLYSQILSDYGNIRPCRAEPYKQRQRELNLVPSPNSSDHVRVAESTQNRANVNPVEPLVAAEGNDDGFHGWKKGEMRRGGSIDAPRGSRCGLRWPDHQASLTFMRSSSNPSTPSDYNSINDDEKETQGINKQQQINKQLKNEYEERENQCELRTTFNGRKIDPKRVKR
ncbi:hypothetical protein EV1_011770 [Malus domestica]